MEGRTSQPNNDLSPLLRIRKKARSAGSPHRHRLHNSTSFASAEFFLDDTVAEDGPSHLDTLWRSHTCDTVLSSSGSYTTGRIRIDSEEDFKAALDRDYTLNLLAGEIIDREISEWQFVCVTGRPSWWSPVSANHRKVQSVDVQQSDIFWDMQEIDGKAKTRPGDRRRASLSDGILTKKIPLQELAHSIALQLLSACFTLPPKNIAGYIPSAFHYYDTIISPDLPDPHLISSLRMHTHFRYTPSFGHNARNSSPAQSWPNSFDGSSPLDSLTNLKTSSHSRCRTSLSSASKDGASYSYPRNFKRRKRNIRRALHVTEESKPSGSWENGSTYHNNHSTSHDELKPTSSSVSLNKGKGAQSCQNEVSTQATLANRASSSLSTSTLDSINKTSQRIEPLALPSLPQRSLISGAGTLRFHTENPRTPPSSRAASLGNGEIHRQHRSLRAIMRSDPHPVFVQPVKELVIRRWRNLRRRFGQPSSPVVATPSHGLSSMTTLPGRPVWLRQVHSSDGTSPLLSSGARERRRRARERGHIRSESWESSIRPTTPVHSGILSPKESSETEFTSEDAENFLSPSAVSESWLSRVEVPIYPSPNTPDQEEQDDRLPGTESQDIVQDHSLNVQRTRETSRTRRSGRKSHSRMSDVFTPDDALPTDTGRNILSAVGSAMQNPVVGPSEGMSGALITSTISLNVLPPSTLTLPADVNRAPATGDEGQLATSALTANFASATNSPPLDAATVSTTVAATSEDELAMQEEDLAERPVCLHRTSTSGTQVWRPAAEGIEVDGLPVGPTMNEKTWEGRREGSFL